MWFKIEEGKSVLPTNRLTIDGVQLSAVLECAVCESSSLSLRVMKPVMTQLGKCKEVVYYTRVRPMAKTQDSTLPCCKDILLLYSLYYCHKIFEEVVEPLGVMKKYKPDGYSWM